MSLSTPAIQAEPSDETSESDSDNAVDCFPGRELSSTPSGKDTSLPSFQHFAGLTDETLPGQSIAAAIPCEIILNIFGFFEPYSIEYYNCLYVCKAWAQCAVESVWYRPSLKSLGTFNKFVAVLSPASRKTNMFPYAMFIRRLNFVYIAKEIGPGYLPLLAECTTLERLTMVGAVQMTNEVLKEVVPKFTKLLALDLSQVSELKDDGLCAIAKSCTLLQGLNVSGCRLLTDTSIRAVAENGINLRRVRCPRNPLT
jgi:F-box and leucine-rich repeat protein GRR1